MTELNVEYAESLLKLALIEHKKCQLNYIGTECANGPRPEILAVELAQFEHIESLLRDSKKLRAIAESVVKASKS